MPIADEFGDYESVTGWKALDLFTDRRDCIRVFTCFLNDTPREQILFFYGDGGNGKSLLLQHLRKHYCKQFHERDWEYINNLDDDEFVSHFVDSELPNVVVTHVNFAISQQSEQSHVDLREQINGLMAIYRQMTPHDFRFPNFVYALVRYFRQVEGKNLDEIESIFPLEEASVIATACDALSGTSIGATAILFFQLCFKYSGTRWTESRLKQMADTEIVAQLVNCEPGQLAQQLPTLLATDLNINLSADERVVLMFDTHEAFRGVHADRSALTRAARLRKDRWFRQFLSHLDLECQGSGYTVHLGSGYTGH